MPHYGTLGAYDVSDPAEDIRGSKVYGLDDEKLGKIEDVIFDHATGNIEYVVIDTGGWLTSKKFIVPAERLRASTEHDGDFSTDLTKQRVQALPAYDENDLKAEGKWGEYQNRYRSKWDTGPIMHREGTDRNITPTTQQLEGSKAAVESAARSTRIHLADREQAQADVDAASADEDRVVPAGADSVVISNSAVGIGGRWDTFQARLRERRKEAVATCGWCTVGPASAHGSENVATGKKAV